MYNSSYQTICGKKKLEEVTTWKRSATGNRTDFLPQRKHSRGSEKLGNGMWSSYRYEPNGHRRFTPSSLPPWFSLSPHQPWTPLVSHDIYEWESFFLVLSLLKINDMPWICHDSTCHCRMCACVWRVCVSVCEQQNTFQVWVRLEKEGSVLVCGF